MGDKQHIAEFLLKLSRDPAKLEEYKNDPEGVMNAHGIDEEHREVIRSGDSDRIHAHLGEDDPPGCLFVLGCVVA